jgi:hypothetical protein
MKMPEFKHREPQISEREIERKYANLEIKTAEPNRVNCYTCGTCGNITKTIDRHHGVTPMFNRCPVCGRQSTSSWYKDIAPDIEPTYEWFVPTLSEVKKYRRNPDMLDHIFNGGLDYRKLKEVKPIDKAMNDKLKMIMVCLTHGGQCNEDGYVTDVGTETHLFCCEYGFKQSLEDFKEKP